MAKTLLIRYGYKEDFERIRLHVREFGFVMDTDEVLIGTSDGNKILPNQKKVQSLIKEALSSYKMKQGDRDFILNNILPGETMFNSTKQRINFLNPVNNKIQTYVTTEDLIRKEPATIKITDDDIDHDDDDSVTLTDFNRPIVMVYYNGVLVTNHEDDNHCYTYKPEDQTIKIKNCSEGDLLTFY